MDAGDLAGVAVFEAAVAETSLSRGHTGNAQPLSLTFFSPHLAGEQRHLQMLWIVSGTALAGLYVSISDAATLSPRPRRSDDTAAEDMIDAVLVLPLHACMHKVAPAKLAAVMDEQNFQAGGPLAE